jgi:hypothetical protein
MAPSGADRSRGRLTRGEAERGFVVVALPTRARKVKIGEIREAGSRSSLRFAPAERMPMFQMTS